MPPRCPVWTEGAIDDLIVILELQQEGRINVKHLEAIIGEQQRHCLALDAYLEDL